MALFGEKICISLVKLILWSKILLQWDKSCEHPNRKRISKLCALFIFCRLTKSPFMLFGFQSLDPTHYLSAMPETSFHFKKCKASKWLLHALLLQGMNPWITTIIATQTRKVSVPLQSPHETHIKCTFNQATSSKSLPTPYCLHTGLNSIEY